MTRRERCWKLWQALFYGASNSVTVPRADVDKIEAFAVEIEQDLIGRWTTEPITEMGWYWVQEVFADGTPADHPRIIHVPICNPEYIYVNMWFQKQHGNGKPRWLRSSHPIPLPKEA